VSKLRQDKKSFIVANMQHNNNRVRTKAIVA